MYVVAYNARRLSIYNVSGHGNPVLVSSFYQSNMVRATDVAIIQQNVQVLVIGDCIAMAIDVRLPLNPIMNGYVENCSILNNVNDGSSRRVATYGRVYGAPSS